MFRKAHKISKNEQRYDAYKTLVSDSNFTPGLTQSVSSLLLYVNNINPLKLLIVFLLLNYFLSPKQNKTLIDTTLIMKNKTMVIPLLIFNIEQIC